MVQLRNYTFWAGRWLKSVIAEIYFLLFYCIFSCILASWMPQFFFFFFFSPPFLWFFSCTILSWDLHFCDLDRFSYGKIFFGVIFSCNYIWLVLQTYRSIFFLDNRTLILFIYLFFQVLEINWGQEKDQIFKSQLKEIIAQDFVGLSISVFTERKRKKCFTLVLSLFFSWQFDHNFGTLNKGHALSRGKTPGP